MRVFGNIPSPYVAIYGLHRTDNDAESVFGNDVKNFILNNVYVDDGLNSLPTPEEAIDLLKRPQNEMINYGNLRLHKFVLNNTNVMSAFPPDDHLNQLSELSEVWNCTGSLGSDTFTFRINRVGYYSTCRGVLSVINGAYDPMGFASPVVLAEKLISKQIETGSITWIQQTRNCGVCGVKPYRLLRTFISRVLTHLISCKEL